MNHSFLTKEVIPNTEFLTDLVTKKSFVFGTYCV
jgi:hypothetical protein